MNKKVIIYTDVTNFIQAKRLTGIQRVVKEVLTGLLSEPELELRFLVCRERKFELVPSGSFAREYFGVSSDVADPHISPEDFSIRQLENGSIFLEIDSSWHCKFPRRELYPLLKRQGVKLAVFWHDIIPIQYPEYVDQTTAAKFLGYAAAALQYGDLFLSSTKANLQAIRDLMTKLAVSNAAAEACTGLGAKEFEKKSLAGEGQEPALGAPGLKSGAYALMVGTVEPRKNHALVLDAFDSKLFQDGHQLVIVGKVGWNVEQLVERIRNHPLLGKQLFFFEEADDAQLSYLYDHAKVLAFASFAEGFGLPLVEAFMKHVPVLSSNHPVMQEVGGDLCEYFDPASKEDFIAAFQRICDTKRLTEIRNRLAEYKPVTWKECVDRFAKALLGLAAREYIPENNEINEPSNRVMAVHQVQETPLRQMVILSGRPGDLLGSLPYTEKYFPFIEEIVVCCPDSMKTVMEEQYHGRFHLVYLTDSDVRGDRPLPKDHALRNIFLRTEALKSDLIDPVFLMGDDDYRALKPVTREHFIKDGVYLGYYLTDLCDWKGTQGNPTSFDISMFKCRDFFMKEKMPTYMFDVHGPQVLEKAVWAEMSETYPEIENEGAASEWSGYFNFLLSRYPEKVCIKPYMTMNWPGHLRDFEPGVSQSDYMFENFYEDVYADTDAYGQPGIFSGIDKSLSEQQEDKVAEKIRRTLAAACHHEMDKEFFETWRERMTGEFNGQAPLFAMYEKEKQIHLAVPSQMEMYEGGFLRFPFVNLAAGEWKETEGEECQLTFGAYQNQAAKTTLGSSRFSPKEERIQVLLEAPAIEGEYSVLWNLFWGNRRIAGETKLRVLPRKDK